VQVSSVAKARGLDEAKIRALVESASKGARSACSASRAVNVLKLNMALDALRP